MRTAETAAAKALNLLPRVNSWCTTGTPIGNGAQAALPARPPTDAAPLLCSPPRPFPTDSPPAPARVRPPPSAADLADLHGLLVLLNHDPFASEDCFDRLIADPYRKSQFGLDPEGRVAWERARALLRQMMLRREKDDPAVLRSLAEAALPPLAEEAPELVPSSDEWVRVDD